MTHKLGCLCALTHKRQEWFSFKCAKAVLVKQCACFFATQTVGFFFLLLAEVRRLKAAPKLITVTLCSLLAFLNAHQTQAALPPGVHMLMKGVCVLYLTLSLMFGMRMVLYSVSVSQPRASHMLDRSSWHEDEPRRVLGLHRVNMVIWVLKLLLLPMDGCWYLVSDLMYLCRCHLRHFLLISPWTCDVLQQHLFKAASV